MNREKPDYATGEWTFVKDDDGHNYCVPAEMATMFSEYMDDFYANEGHKIKNNYECEDLPIRHNHVDWEMYSLGMNPMYWLSFHPQCKIVGHK